MISPIPSACSAAVAPVTRHVHALAHITGGGLPGNLSRSLPRGCGAVVEAGSWPLPPLFPFLQQSGKVERDEMFRVFNMGIGFVAVLSQDAVGRAESAARAASVATWIIGEVVEGEGVQIR